MTAAITERTRLFVDNRWVESQDGKPLDVIEAASEQVLGHSTLASRADIDAAVAAARAAGQGPWGATTPAERADYLERLADAMLVRAASTSELVSRENGMTITLSEGASGQSPARIFRYYAELIRKTPTEDVRPSLRGGRTVVRREPVGVVAAITPWNSPQGLAAMKVAPALAAGCTVVLKPSPETALDAFSFADAALEVDLPPGVLNVVPADREESAYLVGHPGVNKVAFTGSTAAGRAIAQVCGGLLRPVTLELGGKSASIITDDADLDQFTANLWAVSLLISGQACHACTRILAPRSRYPEVVEAVTEAARSMAVGDPLDRSTQIGPLASAAQRSRVLSYIEAGRAEGYQITTGGGTPKDQPVGWFVEPTIFVDVDNSARIAQEEIFGPVLTVTPYETIDDAIRIANDSEYGLGGSVWTTDEERGLQIASQVETGTIGVNGYALDLDAPFGGVKSSGMGYELGPEGIAAYYNTKSVFFSTPG